MTTKEASVEKDDPENLTTTTESSAEEAEETTRPSERLQRRRRRCVYRPRELTIMIASLEEEYGPEDSATTTEASAEDEK